MISFHAPLNALYGVGEKRAALLKKLGMETVGDLLYHFPRGYQNRGDVMRLADAPDGVTGAFVLTISSRPTTARLPGRMTLTKVRAFDESGVCTLTFFNQPYLSDSLAVGASFRFWGRIAVKNGQIMLSPTDREQIVAGKPLPDFTAVYPLTAGLTQRSLAALIDFSLRNVDPAGIPRRIPEAVRQKYGLCEAGEAFAGVHCPRTAEQARQARRYFVFEELYLFSLGVGTAKHSLREHDAPPLLVSPGQMEDFLSALPFSLTGAQQRSIAEIRSDLARDVAMTRMLTGDVGSGKTAVAAAAIYMAVCGGAQAALMAPTEILARQHYADLSALFGRLGMVGALLCGSMKPKEKKAVYAGLANGEIDFAVGTHALISEGVSFRRLGLVITDEQHRFGVRQRTALAEKSGGQSAHTLVMSATPIPRSLALVLWGEMDISTLDELPPGRQKVDTFCVDERYRQRLNGFIARQVTEGHQVYVVCPAIEKQEEQEEGSFVFFETMRSGDEEERLPLKNAEEVCSGLAEAFPDRRVAMVHGKMKAEEKDAVMQDFAAGKIDILVSTTVIEVGVNVPNATLMIVENAERFGLSQLHQLRGRVGRSSIKSYCVLVSDTRSPTSLERLNVMKSTNNGYEIAERDLAMRGPGDFVAGISGENRQSGALRFRLASMADTELLQNASEAAAAVLEKDPSLGKPENLPARQAVRDRFADRETALN